MASALAAPVVAKALPGHQFDHLFFSAASGLIAVSVLIGFGPTYFLAGVFRAHLPNVIISIPWSRIFLLDPSLGRAD